MIYCRRKPQNLTPPLSSDGGSSSTSGQSPNSQHNGSPPPAVKRPSSQAPSSLNNNNSNLINDINYQEPAAKKQRISHYKKPDARDDMRSANQYEGRDGNFVNSRSRDNDDYYGWVESKHVGEIKAWRRFRFSSNTTPNSLEDSGLGLNYSVMATDAINKRIASPINGGQSKSSNGNNGSNNVDQRPSKRNGNRTNGITQSNNTTSSSYDTASIGDDGFRESSKKMSTKSGFRWVELHAQKLFAYAAIFFMFNIDFLPASSDYPPIISVEQRRKYKTEFDKDFAEYRQLHLIMDKTRRRFTNLQQELSTVSQSDQKYKVMTVFTEACEVRLYNELSYWMLLGNSKSNHPNI